MLTGNDISGESDNTQGLTTPAEVFALLHWLEQDEDEPLATRLQRDRGIAAQWTPAPANDPARLVRWWQAVQTSTDDEAPLAQRFDAALGFVRWTVIVLGAISGIAATAGVLAYTGAQPVNLLVLFAVLLGLPMLITLGAALLRLVLSTRAVQALSLLHRPVLGFLDRIGQTGLHRAWGARSELGKTGFWLAQQVTQTYAVVFYLAALATFLCTIAVTDVAFGWRSTLDIQATTIYNATRVMAWPWHWTGIGVPDLTLVEASRVLRLDRDGVDDAQLLGSWWPFVFMALLVWGLVPRLLLWALAGWQVRRSTRALLLSHGHTTSLLQRLRIAHVDYTRTTGTGPGADGTETDTAGTDTRTDRDADGLSGGAPVQHETDTRPETRGGIPVVWNQATRLPDAFECSSLQSDADLTRTLDDIAARIGTNTVANAHADVVIYTKAWEPPVLEFLDFVSALRARIGDRALILVEPVPLPDVPTDEPEMLQHYTVWTQQLAVLGDARLVVSPAAVVSP